MYDNLRKLATTLEKQAVGANAKYHARRAARLSRITESDFDYDPVAYKKFIRKLERRISQLLGKGDTVGLPGMRTRPTTLNDAPPKVVNIKQHLGIRPLKLGTISAEDYASVKAAKRIGYTPQGVLSVVYGLDDVSFKDPIRQFHLNNLKRQYGSKGLVATLNIDNTPGGVVHTISVGIPTYRGKQITPKGYSTMLAMPDIPVNTTMKLDAMDNIALSGRHKRRLLPAAPMHAALKNDVINTQPVRQTLYRAFSPQYGLPAAFPTHDRMRGKLGVRPTWFTHLLDVAGGYGTGGARTYLGQYDLKALKRLGVVGPSTQHIASPTVEVSPVVTLPKFLKTFQRFVPNSKKQLVLKSLRHLRRHPTRLHGQSDLGTSPYYERVVVPKDLSTAQSLGNMSALYKRLPSNRGFQQVYSGGLTPRPVTTHNYPDLVDSVLGKKPITTPKRIFTPKRIAGAGAATAGLALLPEAIRAVRSRLAAN